MPHGHGGGVYKNRTRLYVQHADRHNHIVMLSPTKPEEIRSPNTALFLHPLPPPLNTHIYPATLIAARVDDQDSPVPFTPTMLHEPCADLVATAQRASAETTQAIYDVPAIPLIAVDDEVESVFSTTRNWQMISTSTMRRMWKSTKTGRRKKHGRKRSVRLDSLNQICV